MRKLPFLFLIIFVLATGLVAQTPDPSQTPAKDRTVIVGSGGSPVSTKPGEMRLTRIDSNTDSLSSKHYMYFKENGFRIQMPGNISKYVAPSPASAAGPATDGSVSWNLPEAEILILFRDMDAQALARLTPQQKLQVLSLSLTVMIKKDGVSNLSGRDITVNGIPAKEAKFKRAASEYLVRDLFVGSRLFVFVVLLHQVENAEATVKEALDTFEPLKD